MVENTKQADSCWFNMRGVVQYNRIWDFRRYKAICLRSSDTYSLACNTISNQRNGGRRHKATGSDRRSYGAGDSGDCDIQHICRKRNRIVRIFSKKIRRIHFSLAVMAGMMIYCFGIVGSDAAV